MNVQSDSGDSEEEKSSIYNKKLKYSNPLKAAPKIKRRTNDNLSTTKSTKSTRKSAKDALTLLNKTKKKPKPRMNKFKAHEVEASSSEDENAEQNSGYYKDVSQFFYIIFYHKTNDL